MCGRFTRITDLRRFTSLCGAVWLDPTIQDPARLLPLLTPYPAEEMEVYPVSTKVNSPAKDGPECVEPL